MIWLEVRLTQGREFTAEDGNEVSRVIEEATDIPARRVFCQPEENFAWCYVEAEGSARANVNRLHFLQMQLKRAFRDEVARELDEVNVIDPKEVARFVPEAV